MKEHNWIIKEVNGGHLGVEDCWHCPDCGASGGPVISKGKKPPTFEPFFADGSGLIAGHDCEEAKRLIDLHLAKKNNSRMPCPMCNVEGYDPHIYMGQGCGMCDNKGWLTKQPASDLKKMYEWERGVFGSTLPVVHPKEFRMKNRKMQKLQEAAEKSFTELTNYIRHLDSREKDPDFVHAKMLFDEGWRLAVVKPVDLNSIRVTYVLLGNGKLVQGKFDSKDFLEALQLSEGKTSSQVLSFLLTLTEEFGE